MSMNDYHYNIHIKIDKDDVKEMAKEVGKEVAEKSGTGLKDGIKDAWLGVEKVIKNRAVNLLDSLIKSVGQLFKDAVSEMTNMLQYSKLSDPRTRELAFGMGLSSSQAYGYEKAMSLLGFSSEEDLMYANQQELKQFRAAFEKYSNYYDELAESGYFQQMQEYQVEMEDFKMQMQQEVIGFFIDNKDEIMSVMKAILTFTSWFMKGASWLFGKNSSDQVASTTDIVSQYNTTSTSNSNASLSVVNNFNNVDSSVSGDISREVNNEYRQVIKALGGNV